MAACKKDPGTLNETPNLIFNPKGTKVLNLEATKATTPFAVTISRTMAKEKPLSITIGVDETKLPDGKSLPDADYYSIDQTVIPMGANVGQVEFTVTFESQAMYENLTEEEWDDFALPIVIKSVSPAIDLNAANTTVIIDLTVRGATIIGEAAEHFAEVFAGGEPAKITLNATANYSADETGVSYTVDADGVDEYNTENETSLALLPSSAYSVGAGAWDEREIGEDTNENGEIDANESVKEEIITNEITINTSLAAGTYILPLKLATSEDGINVVQDEPIYILVESVPAATPGIVMNGDFEAPLPYMMRFVDYGHAYGLDEVKAGAPGVWKNKYEWLSPNNPSDVPPSIAAVASTSIVAGGGPDGSDCFLMECTAGTFDYVLAQKITGLDPDKVYTLSAKVMITDVTDTEKSNGVTLGYWPKGSTYASKGSQDGGASKGTSGTPVKTFDGTWVDTSCLITSIEDNGEAIIFIRFGSNGHDTDGKAYIDDVKIEEYDEGGIVSTLSNGDFATAVTLPSSMIAKADRATFALIEPGKWVTYDGWNGSIATFSHSTTEGIGNSGCLKIALAGSPTNGAEVGFVQRLNGLTPGDVYTYSASVKTSGMNKNDGHYVVGGTIIWWKPDTSAEGFPNWPPIPTGPSKTPISFNEDWKEISMDITVPDSGSLIIGLNHGYGNGDVDGTTWFDNVTLTKN